MWNSMETYRRFRTFTWNVETSSEVIRAKHPSSEAKKLEKILPLVEVLKHDLKSVLDQMTSRCFLDVTN